MALLSFLFFLIGITGVIGFMAARKSKRSESDYFLASQEVSPYVLALSGSASKSSGFVFAGFMGAAFTSGTAVIWMNLCLLAGSFVSYILIIFRLQQMNHGGWALSLSELITFQDGENRVWLRRLLGLLTLFFLSLYAAAQLKAGGKALEVALGQPAYVGILLSVVIILFYCWAGGIRASIWTDTVQLAIMVGSLLMVLTIATVKQGGVGAMYEAFMATAPVGSDQTSLLPQNLSIGGYGGLALFCLGMFGLGLCSCGQPHVLVRAMALAKRGDTKKFLITSLAFETVFFIPATLVGLSTRIILQDAGSFDPELALFLSAQALLPAIAVGVVLAGAFSSSLSTADSQIISCSASLSRDLPEPPSESLMLAKAGTVSVALLATAIALWADKSIFMLVIFAFSGLGTSIGSLLVLRLYNVRMPEWGGVLIALAGSGTVIVWVTLGLSKIVNESIAGFAAAFLALLIVKLVTRGKVYDPSL